MNLPVNYKSEFYRDKESLALINESKSELVLFIEDYKKTKLVLLNSDFEIKSEFEMPTLPKSFKNYLGYTINKDNSYSIFYSNLKKTKFGRLDFDFKTKETSVHKLDFSLNFEGFVKTVKFNNVLYIISVTNRSNDVHFYTNNDKGSFDKKTISFNFLEEKEYGKKKRASNFMSRGSLETIDVALSNNYGLILSSSKIYLKGEEFIFTFDQDKNKTIVVTLNPTNFNVKHDVFQHSEVIGQQFSKHNSYIFDNKLFQISSSREQMKFTVKDFKTKELIKDIVLNKPDSIMFKNTPIIQGTTSSKETMLGLTHQNSKIKEIEATSKFLKKITRDKIGISVYKQNTNFSILLGGEVINTSGGASMPGFGGVPIGGFGPLSVSFNPTFSAYGNYALSTYIGCLFDENLEHLKGEIEKNGLDKIKDFEDSFDSKNIYAPKAKLTNVFSFNNKLYFGYLNTEDKNYHLIEFEK
ncbi:hypothetical protein [Algibacter sp. L4_22]|uniref:hypothetical protein n=1 Tax=Algibacter sp. L4_22 TaxID=2942477 RepID=UPI00201B66D0|nr:hypothetical protein [Algibacter sp. L4_22]MCL5127413.1 hypothetical protein [Algibacter sp. L4_22]